MSRITSKQKQLNWEDTIEKMLGDENPCRECLVKVTCAKSFSYGDACEKLAERLENKINENKSRLRDE